MKVGFIGTGVMGSRMVDQFLYANYEVVVYSRTKEKADPLIERGAIRANSVAALAQAADVICTCLSMPEDVEQVYIGKDGVIHNAKEGTICIDFTTVGVETSEKMFTALREKGITYLDAPVSGGPEGVEQGALTIMVGGLEDAFRKVQPLLHTIGETVQFLGNTGSGSVAKLVNQYLVAAHSLAASEAMVMGTALGLQSEQLYGLLKVSYGDSRMLRRHMEHFVLDRQFEPGGAVKYLHKDVKLANELFEKIGMGEFSGQLAEQALQDAMNEGHADDDMSAVIKPIEKKCDVIVKR